MTTQKNLTKGFENIIRAWTKLTYIPKLKEKEKNGKI